MSIRLSAPCRSDRSTSSAIARSSAVSTRRSRVGLDSEGYGLVYREAAACKRPAIAANIAGCREAVIHGRTGLLVPPDDAVALSRAMTTLLDDPSYAAELGASAYQHVRAAGGWDQTAAQLLSTLTAASPS